ncbi:MAG: DUF2207 domain-containing protein [Bacilli bacterium]|nr:DUF2207 domain-containing protein [Bacilli bacterium]
MRKILFIVLLTFCFTINAKADSINKITMDIYLDKYGTAHITEKWDVIINSGTEGYKPYYNIGNASFTNFKVKDQNKEYDLLSYWNTKENFKNKSYKNGINYLSNGLELCWGISNYGKNIYTLNYEIQGFVAETIDKQMIYWTLIPYELSLKPKDVSIVIRSDEKFSDDTPVWGYGNYGGTAYVYDGLIEMNSPGKLNSNEYMTILVEFPKGTFATNNILDNSFEYYYNMAEEDVVHYKESHFSKFIAFLIFFIQIALFTIIPIIIVKYSVSKNKNFEKKISKGKFPKDLNYFRDIPCDKDIHYAFFLAHNYNLTKNKNDFLGALILNWVKHNYVKVEMKEKKGLFKKGEEATLVMDAEKFQQIRDNNNYLENDMFDYMYEASKDGILESKEFSKYCENHYNKILRWFDKVLDYQKQEASTKELLIKEKKVFTKYYETYEIYNEAMKLAGSKKFLQEFSSIEDKSATHVHLWEYYLMYAQIFGIAKTVAEEFKKMYPDVITDVSYNNVVFINTMSYTSLNKAVSAKSKAESYSSGGGGFSSGGGGGGSFGGGGGGGGFR